MESLEAYQSSEPGGPSYEIQLTSQQDHLINSWTGHIEAIEIKPLSHTDAPEVPDGTPVCDDIPAHEIPLASERVNHEAREKKVPNSIPLSSRGKDVYKTEIKEENGAGCQQCVLCTSPTDNSFDVFTQMTYYGHVTLCSYICKVASVELIPKVSVRKYACRSCYDLLNVVEQAEIEYLKHRDILIGIVTRNSELKHVSLDDNFGIQTVKVENCKFENEDTSDDEPLAVIKSSNHNNRAESTAKNERIHYGDLTDDEDFYWELDSKEDCFKEKKEIKCSFKKRGRPKKSKKVKVKDEIELDHRDPTEMLIVELKEEVKLEDSNIPVKKKKTAAKMKETKEIKKKDFHKENSKTKNKNLTCEKCNKTFAQKAYYDCHMARHDPSLWPYICEICGKGFYNRKICDTHVLMHQGIAEYKCIPCNKLFLTKFAFKRHDKIHQGKPKHQCDLCGKSFIHTSSFRMHKMIHAGIKKYACDICGLAMLSSSHLIRHKRIHSGEKRFECDVCGKKFTEKYNMQVHARVHMKNSEQPPSPTDLPVGKKRWFRCERCEEKFDRLFKLEIHLVDDHKIVLKKGRPKPRNTMKKLQRAQQAAASMVSAFASVIEAKNAAEHLSVDGVDVKPSVDALDEKIKKASISKEPALKASPDLQPELTVNTATSGAAAARQYMQQEQMFRSAGTVWPHMTYTMGMGYLGRMPDYSPPN